MESHTVNVLLTSFPGLGLPATLSLPLSSKSTIADLTARLQARLPSVNNRILLTTNSNKLLSTWSSEPISTLLSSPTDKFLPLRLTVPLCGGKGGFGSQLRAAGGRMSSRKNKNSAANNGSNRNLDGRRLRTVAEAKALAEYLAIKPEMEKKEKEERRRRWEQVVEMAERKQEEIRNGGKGRLDGAWVESKEEAETKTREAVLAALKAGDIQDVLGRESDASASGSGPSDGSESEMEEDAPAEASASKGKVPARTFFGWDEEEDLSSDEDEVDEDMGVDLKVEGKGKARA